MAQVVASIAINALVQALTAEDPDPPPNPLDDKPTPMAKHGSFIPLIFGTVRVAPLFAWVGDRSVVYLSSGGGKAIGTSGTQTQTQVYEKAWHLLGIGPAYAITKIFTNGGVQFDSLITADSHPSGTVVSYPNSSGFKPYWGESDQPIDALISAKVAASRFPGLFGVVWGAIGGNYYNGGGGMFLGGGSTWPSMEYEVQARVAGSPLKNSPAWMEESALDKGDTGVNPAHALWQLLTQTYPRGAGIDESNIDMAALERIGELCAEEHIPMNVRVGGGQPVSNIVAAILSDLSVALPQVGEVLSFVPVRVDNNPASLPSDIVIPPRPQIVFKHGRKKADRLVFTYKDQTNNFEDQDLAVDDDSSAEIYGVPKVRSIPLRTVTHSEVAATVADRRQQEELVDTNVYTIRATRGARVLVPGQAFIVEGLGQLRLLSSRLDDESNQVVLEAVSDVYAPAATGYQPPTPDINIPAYDAENDLSFVFFEFPYAVEPGLKVGVFRIRANSAIIKGNVWLSGNGTAYQQNHRQNAYSAGGELTEAFEIGTDTEVDQGPAMDAANSDIESIMDLTGDDENWRLGLQVVIFHNETTDEHEIMFMRKATALGGSSWRLDGLIRARYDTVRRAFPIGTRVYIFKWIDIEKISDPLIIEGLTLYLKTQPGTAKKYVDVAGVTPFSRLIVGRGARPLPPDNFRANDDGSYHVDEYSTGGDILFEWTYRVRDGAGAAASEQLAGQAIEGQPPHDGVFKVEIIDPSGPTVVRTFTIDSDVTQQLYTNAQLVSDFGGEPATFDARLTNVEGVYVSDEREVSVVKV